MTHDVNHNALLLQVMAHDLLAPLTAIKWQLELLGKEGLDSTKRYQYMQSIQDSTELGITLTKHAHVAGRVLVGSYELSHSNTSLADTIRKAAHDLRLQYERHGLMYEVEIDDDSTVRTIDTELVGLFVWSMAKLFLSCTPAQSSVSFRGIATPVEGSVQGTYSLIGSAENVPACADCLHVFTSGEARSGYDQTYVFVKLLRDLSPMIGVTLSANMQGTTLVVEASFDVQM